MKIKFNARRREWEVWDGFKFLTSCISRYEALSYIRVLKGLNNAFIT